MPSIKVVWSTGTFSAPGGTIVDHANIDLLDGSANVVQSQAGAAGSGLPSNSQFDNVVAGNGYIVRARNFDQHGSQLGPDVLTNPVDVSAPNVDVTIITGGAASVL